MTKVLLLSVVAMTVAVPTLAARASGSTRGLRWALGWWALFVLAYGAGLNLLPPPGG
jgi:hypothetical protein